MFSHTARLWYPKPASRLQLFDASSPGGWDPGIVSAENACASATRLLGPQCWLAGHTPQSATVPYVTPKEPVVASTGAHQHATASCKLPVVLGPGWSRRSGQTCRVLTMAPRGKRPRGVGIPYGPSGGDAWCWHSQLPTKPAKLRRVQDAAQIT